MDITLIIVLSLLTLVTVFGSVLNVGLTINLLKEIKKEPTQPEKKDDGMIVKSFASLATRIGKMEESIQEWQKAYVSRFNDMVDLQVKKEAIDKPMFQYVNQLKFARDKWCKTSAEVSAINRIIRRINEDGGSRK